MKHALTKPALSELRALKEDDALTPEGVVEAAASLTSALHAFFEWDDTQAAHCWRLNQAKGLIREVAVHWVEPKGPRQVKALVSAVSPKQLDRRSSEQPPSSRVQKLRAALRDLLEVQREYEDLSELSGVRIAIAAFSKLVVDIERKAQHK